MNIEAGGSADVANLYLFQQSKAEVTVTGAGSKLTASTSIVIGWLTSAAASTQILTVENGGLVQTDLLKFSLDDSGSSVGGYVHMGEGGILAVSGDKTFATTGIDPFVAGGLFSKHNAANVGEIQYDNGGWTNMTGATEGTDYTLEYHTSGTFNGHTVLTMVPEPATMSLLAIGGIALLRRKRRA